MHQLKRITPLRIVKNLAAAGEFYASLGAERKDSNTPHCRGYRAGDTGVILTDRTHAETLYGKTITNDLAKRGALYCYVNSVDAQLETLPPHTRLTTDGVDEAVMEQNGEWLVLAAVITPAVTPAKAGVH